MNWSRSQLEELYVAYAERLRLFIKGVLKDADLAEEIVQTTFLKLSEQPVDLEILSIKAWLYRVALNEALTYKRRQNVDVKARKRLLENSDVPLGTEQQTSREELSELLRQAIKTLPDLQQEVVRKKYMEGKTFTVIAEEVEAPLGTVLTRMRLALSKLHKEMSIHFPEYDPQDPRS